MIDDYLNDESLDHLSDIGRLQLIRTISYVCGLWDFYRISNNTHHMDCRPYNVASALDLSRRQANRYLLTAYRADLLSRERMTYKRSTIRYKYFPTEKSIEMYSAYFDLMTAVLNKGLKA